MLTNGCGKFPTRIYYILMDFHIFFFHYLRKIRIHWSGLVCFLQKKWCCVFGVFFFFFFFFLGGGGGGGGGRGGGEEGNQVSP